MAQAMRQLASRVDDDIMADMLRVRSSNTRSKQNNFDIPGWFRRSRPGIKSQVLVIAGLLSYGVPLFHTAYTRLSNLREVAIMASL